MTMLMISGTLLGAVLGLRFKVLVLLPAIIIGTVSLAAVAFLHGNAVSTTAFAMMAWALALQFGYLTGLFTRFVLAVSRSPRLVPDRASLARTSS
jgi:hypothetical protein